MISRHFIKLLLILVIFLLVIDLSAQNIGINATGLVPNTSAGLDVDFSNKGMLVPRVALTGTTDVSTITTPATSLLVYNTATAGTSPTNVTPGFYYWSGTAWLKLMVASSASNDWSTSGNAGTNYLNFIGTTDNVPLKFKVNNVFAGKISDTNLVIGVDANNMIGGYNLYNTVLGTRAMRQPFHSSNNVVIGYEAMLSGWVNNNENVVIGASALRGGGEANIAIGYQSLFAGNNYGALAIGNASSYHGASGIAIGHSAKYNATNNSYGIGIGYAALYKDRGISNIGIGDGSMYDNLTGTNNVALGTESLSDNTTGNSNTAIGHYALKASSGSKNTSVGDSSGIFNANGTLNTYLGYNARSNYILGSFTNATAIGANSFVSASNSLVLGNNANVGIGTSAPAEKLEVVGKTKTNQLQVVTGANTGYVLTSDASGNATWQSPSVNDWSLTGNAGTIPGTHFIGTTDNTLLYVKTNNVTRMTVTANGAVGINNSGQFFQQLTVGGGYSSVDGENDMYYVFRRAAAHRWSINETATTGIQFKQIYNDAGAYNNVSFLDIADNGNIGIGTSTPSAKLEIVGQIKITGGTPGAGKVLVSDASGLASWQTVNTSWVLTGNAGTSAATNFIGTTDAIDFVTRTNSTERMRITSGGNVGIGTTAPVTKLGIISAASAPAIPNTTSTAICRIGISNSEGIDFGKGTAASNYAGWIQSGFNGGADPLALQPSGGNLGIGTTNPTQKLTVFNGTTTGTYTTTGWVHSSDARLKTNVIKLDNSLEKVMKLNGVSYNWMNNPNADKQIGFIAQEVKKIVPEVVVVDSEGNYGMAYQNLNALLVEAMKEQQTQIEDLKSKYELLLKEVEQMKLSMNPSTTEVKN